MIAVCLELADGFKWFAPVIASGTIEKSHQADCVIEDLQSSPMAAWRPGGKFTPLRLVETGRLSPSPV
jgi:hypothetical protein